MYFTDEKVAKSRAEEGKSTVESTSSVNGEINLAYISSNLDVEKYTRKSSLDDARP